ncbi:hypothetical protein ACMYSQ_003086 [Aspergillus niger]
MLQETIVRMQEHPERPEVTSKQLCIHSLLYILSLRPEANSTILRIPVGDNRRPAEGREVILEDKYRQPTFSHHTETQLVTELPAAVVPTTEEADLGRTSLPILDI